MAGKRLTKKASTNICFEVVFEGCMAFFDEACSLLSQVDEIQRIYLGTSFQEQWIKLIPKKLL